MMNTDARDPILRGLDQLAGMADRDEVADRMPGIVRKARTNRNRKVAAGAATFVALLAIGVPSATQVLSGGDATDKPPPAGDPTVGVEPTAPSTPVDEPAADIESPPSSTPVARDELSIDLDVNQIGPTTVGALFRIQGTAQGYNGPSYIHVQLDGQQASGSDFLEQLNQHGGGEPVCEGAGAPQSTFDQTFTDFEQKGLNVDVPGPGTYTVTVQAPYCDVDGNPVANEVSQTVTVTQPDKKVTDETQVDIDGDGRNDVVRLTVPEADRGDSYFTLAEVTLAAGQQTEIPLVGFGRPTIGGTADLDGDGVAEVAVVSENSDHHSWWTVLTSNRGDVVGATPVGAGEQDVELQSGAIAGGNYQMTWLRDDQLVSWFTSKPWDGQTKAKVYLQPWVLDSRRGQIHLDDAGGQTLCVTPDPSTWTDPVPC